MFRTLSHVMLCMLLMLACMHTAKAQCPAATPLVINSVTVTESRCSSSGTATVLVSGGSAPYTYYITAGVVSPSPQTSNILQSLAPGNYTVQVTDKCGTFVTNNFTVTGTYDVPSLNLTSVAPECPAGSDGSITMNATGRGPFTYSLISPSPVTAGPQAGNVFTSLPAGTYTCQVKDSCGNFQTRTVNLTTSTSSVAINGYGGQYLSCDSFVFYVYATVSGYRPPYTTTVTLPNGTVLTHVLNAPAINGAGNLNDTFRLAFSDFSTNLPVTITNRCGATSSVNLYLGSLGLSAQAFPISSGCGGQYEYSLDPSPSLHCSGVTYTLVSPSGTVLATKTNNPFFSGYPPGTGYKVIRKDCCSRTDTLQFDWAGPPAFKINSAYPAAYASCKEGTAALYMTFNKGNPVEVVVASGPPSVTYADGTTYSYTYPDTVKDLYYTAILNYFGPGTYHVYAIEQCSGQKDSATIRIGPSNLRHSTFNATLQKGCTNASKILLSANSNATGIADANITVGSVYSKTLVRSYNFSDVVTGLSSGTYPISYQYANSFSNSVTLLNGMPDPGCDVIKDTIVVPVYTQPAFSTAAVTLCGATRQVALVTDSTSGVTPYQYQISAGPTTTSLQASPVFTGLVPGTYTFLMADACANSYSRSITIDTLAVPNVVTTGSTCVGGAVTFTLPSSSFYSYSWQRPNGSTSAGNTLTLNPVTTSDAGTYTITVTSTVGGCTSTSSKSLTLNACSSLAETLLRFNGQRKNGNIQLNWQTADEINMGYYIVERSTDGIVFTPVQQVAAKEEAQNTYTATDTHVPAGLVYYRIESVEKSGTINYSPIISFNNVNAQPFNVYPSLITGNTPVTVTGPVTSHTTFIRVIGADGKVWRTIPVAAGTTKTSIDVTNLARGSYFVVVTGNDNVMATQVWKE